MKEKSKEVNLINDTVIGKVLFAEYAKFLDDVENKRLSCDEFSKRQAELLEKMGFEKKHRPDLQNFWLEPDGTNHKLDDAHDHNMWAMKNRGMNMNLLMYEGWVKVTHWDGKEINAMHYKDLTFEQEEFIKQRNIKAFRINMLDLKT